MNDSADFLTHLGVTITEEHGVCRALYKEHNAAFAQITPEQLRLKLNEGMGNAVRHYTQNVKAAGVMMEPRQIQEVAFSVVLYHVCVYNKWRTFYEEHKNHSLAVSAADLEHPQSHNQCWFYCEKEFGVGYAPYAAALTGMTLEAYKRYEDGQRRFFDR